MTSDNPAPAGRFMAENFSAKRHNAATIKNNIDDLSKLKDKIDSYIWSISLHALKDSPF